MREINTTRTAMFTLFALATIAVNAQGIQTNAFAAHSDTYFEAEGSVLYGESKSTTGEGDFIKIVQDLRAILQDLSDEDPESLPVK